MKSIEAVHDYHVYPNPATHALSLKADAQFAHEVLNVKLYSSAGVLVRSTSKEANQDIMEVEGLPNGIYYLTVQSGVKVQTFKIIIQ